ncbi:hypothetical protein, partial [Streptomyces sp. NPDC088360]|uniref:hypothetical protein n=1 Tax=Streptomyces sp. NPDC088360 TaxID=3154515 RepID=UPI00345040DE
RAFLRALPFGVSLFLFLRFRLYQTLSCPIFLGAFQVSAPAFRLSRFPFRRFRLYQKFSAGLTGVVFLIYRVRLLGL